MILIFLAWVTRTGRGGGATAAAITSDAASSSTRNTSNTKTRSCLGLKGIKF